MSKIALTPSATGTGVFTISSPATNTDRTLTLPDEAGTVLTSASSLASANLTGTVTVSGGNVGIGTGSPQRVLVLSKSDSTGVQAQFTNSTTGVGAGDGFTVGIDGSENAELWNYQNTNMVFATGAAERMRIDSSGNVLVGKTAQSVDTVGGEILSTGIGQFTVDGNFAGRFTRQTSDGDIVVFRKGTGTRGSIGASGSSAYLVLNTTSGSGVGLFGSSNNGGCLLPANETGAAVDNVKDLGRSDIRWDDIYATNNVINTSDRNEKQDIDVMSEAETRVAVACKGLMRKFRWIDAVAKKGDDARIHFGIIAQDLQDAFAAEGLDAGRYAMFISSTWWEANRVVPAVEAVEGAEATYDDEGNQLTEAVEAVVAVAEHTVTDHYDTLEEAPEGATERTRLGVRYPELLAFIIGAL
jgi:hypothetical protein